MLEFNNKNDRHFKIIPHADDQYRLITSETNQKALELRKVFFEKKYKEFFRKAEKFDDNNSGIKEFIVEVQKAAGLNKSGFCFEHGKPYVVVSLEPGGDSKKTFSADYFKPKWYQVMHFKTLINFNQIKFEVKIENSEKTYGEFYIKVKDIEDQNVHKKSYLIGNGTHENLLVRVQYIYNEKKLYKEYERRCLDFIDQISELLNKDLLIH